MRCASVSGNARPCGIVARTASRHAVKAVVQDDEVTDALELFADEVVVARNIGGVKLLVRKVIEQIEQCVGQRDAGRWRASGSRKPAATPSSHDVLVPEFPAPALR